MDRPLLPLSSTIYVVEGCRRYQVQKIQGWGLTGSNNIALCPNAFDAYVEHRVRLWGQVLSCAVSRSKSQRNRLY